METLLKSDRDADQFRVFLPTIEKLPPNPHEFGQGALQHASETTNTESELSPEDKRLQHQLLACDQRSFITGSAAADLRASHIIKFVNTNQLRKQELEDYLTQQRLQDPSRLRFLLDSPTNAILLEASLHVHWDLYGTFCIVPSESDATAMLDALNNINDRWAKYDPIESMTRPLDITQPPFAQPHWDIVVLHPHAFLPEFQPLAIALNRTYTRGQSSQPVPSLTWTSWIAEGDQLCSASPPHAPLTPFVVDNLRSVLQRPVLSSLTMVINAQSKLDLFMRNHGSSITPRVQRLAQLMSDLVTAIFFVPQGYRGAVGQPLQVSQPEVALSPTGSVLVGPGAPGYPLGPGASRHPQFPSFRSGRHSKADDEQSVDSLGSPETPGDDGLTALEFQIVAARANDSFLDPKQRADAAMTMLCGTCRLQTSWPSMPDGLC